MSEPAGESYELVPYGLAVSYEYEALHRIRLTWRERLLSWPWRPWVRYRAVPMIDYLREQFFDARPR